MDRLDALQSFVRVVELGSFSAVARELCIRQSTVSKWMAALEEELAVQLLDRTTRRQRVTEAGALFYDRAKQILAAYEDAARALRSDDRALRGRLVVSLPVVFGRLHVVPHVADFLLEHPELEVELRFDDRYVNLVEEGADVAIRVGTPRDSSFKAIALASTPRRLVAAPDYLAAAPALDAPDDLADHRCLLHSGLRHQATWTVGEERVRVRGRFAADNSHALLVMAKRGLGVALLASWLVDDAIGCGELVHLLPDEALPPAPVQALLPPGRFVHPRVRAFVDHLRDAMAL